MEDEKMILITVVERDDNIICRAERLVDIYAIRFIVLWGSLRELVAFGDLELHSAWLYYGSMAAAARTLDLSLSAFRQLLHQPDSIAKLSGLLELPEPVLEIISDGSFMLMEMADTERDAMFSSMPPPAIKESYIKAVESWRQLQIEKGHARGHGSFPIAAARDLLEGYVRMWKIRHHVRKFFECSGVKRPLQHALQYRTGIEGFAASSKICAIAMDIIGEHDTYRWQWVETRKHIEAQKRIISKKHGELLEAVGKRDGFFCAACRIVVEKLDLDHITPVSHGGFSVVENL